MIRWIICKPNGDRFSRQRAEPRGCKFGRFVQCGVPEPRGSSRLGKRPVDGFRLERAKPRGKLDADVFPSFSAPRPNRGREATRPPVGAVRARHDL